MGGITFSTRSFYEQTSELVGIKSGLLLDDHLICKILKEDFDNAFLSKSENYIIRLRSEEIENMIRYIRCRIGNLPNRIDHFAIMKKYGSIQQVYRIYMDYSFTTLDLLREGKEVTLENIKSIISKDKTLNTEFITALSNEIYERHDDCIAFPSIINTETPEPLNKLFDSEAIPKTDNTFIDQKFIDYLAVNGNEIELIHWRNFERFVAEYFKRQGFEVMLGPGSNDGGIDIRVFSISNPKEPYIVIQCKRFKSKRKVSIETVKAFHSDVTFEKAKSGLIATSSHIEPGGKKVVDIRKYNISFAENKNVKKWATNMWQYKKP